MTGIFDILAYDIPQFWHPEAIFGKYVFEVSNLPYSREKCNVCNELGTAQPQLVFKYFSWFHTEYGI